MQDDTTHATDWVSPEEALWWFCDPALVRRYREAEGVPLTELPATRLSTRWKGGRVFDMDSQDRRAHHLRPFRKALEDDLVAWLRRGALHAEGIPDATLTGRQRIPSEQWHIGRITRWSDDGGGAATINGRTWRAVRIGRAAIAQDLPSSGAADELSASVEASPATPSASRAVAPSSALVPPIEGWTLVEAATALCPAQMAAILAGSDTLVSWYRARGAREDARLADRAGSDLACLLTTFADDDWTHAPEHGRIWLAEDLLAAVCARLDLTFSGEDCAKGVGAQRIVLSRAAITDAGDHDDAPSRLRIELPSDLASPSGGALVVQHKPVAGRPPPPDCRLVAVRVERVASQEEAAPASIVVNRGGHAPAQQPLGSGAGLLPFDEQTLRVEYMARLNRRRLAGEPHPSEEEDLAWARQLMNGVTRVVVRRLRQSKLPPEARKRGPKGRRNRQK